MVFSSVIFLFVFLPLVLTGYLLLKDRWRNSLLLACNLVFYAWGEGPYIIVLIVCTIGNYLFGLWIQRERDRNNWPNCRNLVGLAIVFNLSLLLIFKYTNFIIGNLNILLRWAELGTIKQTGISLPIGLSFFTFQGLSFVLDVYRGAVRGGKGILGFSVYQSFFGTVLAGPIVRYKDVATQIADRVISSEGFKEGIRRFVIGLGKKVLIASTVGSVADEIFSLPAEQLSLGNAWLGIVCYTLQIFFDFSGYSDMAIGLGRMLGFTFLENFNYPYISKSIREFWRRWHISLSTWFRDYLYISLGGNKTGTKRTYLNLLIVFLLCGLWHGASWTFIVWGLWHGMFLILERSPVGKLLQGVWTPLRHSYALLVVMTGWVFFRSNSWGFTLDFLKAMYGFGNTDVSSCLEYFNSQLVVVLLVGAVGCIPILPALSRMMRKRSSAASGGSIQALRGLYLSVRFSSGIILFVLSSMSLFSGTHNPFIYFRF
jgi:alginate O-acetyltransferase complex protein AlgI